MLQLILHLPDDRYHVVDAEGKSVGSIATDGAAQSDAHRDEQGPRLWTLALEHDRQSVPIDARVDDVLAHGDIVTLVEIERAT